MSWNSLYTHRKQKEMSKKSADYQKSNDPYKYTEYTEPKRYTTKWHEESARERRMKIITTVMLSLMSMIYIAIIVYFIKYGA